MKFRELAVPDAYEVTPTVHSDDRGTFVEWFKPNSLEEFARRGLVLSQANFSLSRRGVLRGVHFADVPPGQAKYVSCLRGAVLDVVVDIRVGSPMFGQWDSVVLDDREHRATFLSEGLGHAFMALTDDAAVAYLCSTPYTPSREHALNPLDPDLAIGWPADLEPTLSAKDLEAPSLREAAERGLLPSHDACRAYYAELGAVDDVSSSPR